MRSTQRTNPLSRKLAHRQHVAGLLPAARAFQKRLDPRENCLAAEDDTDIPTLDLAVPPAAWAVSQDRIPLGKDIKCGVEIVIRGATAASGDNVACVAAVARKIDAAAMFHIHGRSYFGFHPRAIPADITQDAV